MAGLMHLPRNTRNKGNLSWILWQGIFSMLLYPAFASAQSQFQGEEILRLFHPAVASWEISFEKDGQGFRPSPRAEIHRSREGQISVHLPDSSAEATGIAAVPGHYDLSRTEEIHLWVQADAPIRVQPFSQTSGYVFKDGGDPDVKIPGDGRIVRLRIGRASMADPSMVETIGLQVRPGAAAGANLRLIAVTALFRSRSTTTNALAISDVNVPPSGSRYSVFTANFNLSRTYENPYDPDQIDAQARIVVPSGKEITFPAFWFQDYQVAPGSEGYEQYVPTGTAHWKVRYLPEEEGRYSIRIRVRDKDGNVDEAGPFDFSVTANRAPGPVRRHLANPLSLQYANGAPYIPLGHNLGFEDGNPDLNGTAYYRSLLPAFASSGENWTRLWMTDFSRTALEWDAKHFSGFYQGIGVYSQRAAWRVDQFFEIAFLNGVQIQLVLNDHGQVSNWVNARWDSGNPYGSTYGGPVPQSNPEQFFSNPTARSLHRRRLRYAIARWAAYPNLLAWELFNEVQWAGSQTRNIQNDSATRAAIADWHREMADSLKAQDPIGHLVTTSSDDYGSSSFAAIWNLASIDMIQSHHYAQPPSTRDARIRDVVAAMQQAYRKPVIIGEMGVKADSQPECNFDPDGFLTNPDVPASERTPANRDHLKAGTILRNGLWSAALTQSGGMNWWWGCYMAEDQKRHRQAPDFPLHARLFPPLVSFWGGEDPAAGSLRNAALQTSGQILAYGLQGPSQAFVWVRDTRNAYGSGYAPATTESRNTDGAAVIFSGLDPGSYVLSFYDSYSNGDLLSQSEASIGGGTFHVPLPPFQGDTAFKVSRGTACTWGAVPRSGKAWITGGDAGDARVLHASMRSIPGFSDALGGAVLTLSDNQVPTWELTVPALRPSKGYWTVAEIGAPSHTGLALVNHGSSTATILLQINDANGRQAANRTLTLAPGEHVAKFLLEWFGQALAPFRGTLEVRSDQPLGALALRGTDNDLGQFIMTSIPARGDEGPLPGQTEAVPQVAEGGGYQTEWLMLNSSDVPLTGKITVRKSDGTAWPLAIQGTAASELPYSSPAHGLIRWTTAGALADVSVGYCLLVPDAGQAAPAGGVVIRYLPGGGLRSETGLPFLGLSVTAGTYWEVGPDLDTGIALVNTSDREQQIRLRLFLRDGSEQVRQAQVSVPAGGHMARFLTQIFANLPTASRGYLLVSADAPCGFLPLRMRTTAHGVLFSSLLLGPLTGGAECILPQVVSGGGYRTQFILANPGDLTSSGRMSFYDPSGIPARLLLRRP